MAALLLAAVSLGCGERVQPIATRVNATGVVLSFPDRAIAGARVQVGNRPQVVTGPDGRYDAGEVDVPYNIVIVVPGFSGAPLITVYQGILRGDVTVHTTDYAAPRYSANLSGAIRFPSATTFPLPTNARQVLNLGTPDIQFNNMKTTFTGNGDWNFAVDWSGPSTQTTTLRVLAWEEDTLGVPSRYTGFGALPGVNFSDHLNLTGLNVKLDPVALTNEFTGTVQVPTGYSHVSRNVGIYWVSNAPIYPILHNGSSLPSNFEYPVPVVPEGRLQLRAGAKPQTGGCGSEAIMTGLALDASNVQIAVPRCSEVIQPIDAAAGVGAATDFMWDPFAGGLHALEIYPAETGSSAPTYTILTAATSARVPDLTSMGITLPAAAAYRWKVLGLGPCPSIHAALTNSTCHLFGYDSPQEQQITYSTVSYSTERSFTTAP